MSTSIKSRVFSNLQKIGQSLMTPVSVLPAAGLLVALGRLLLNASETTAGIVTNPIIHGFGKLCFNGGLAIFEQLPVVFAVGVAIGFTGGAGVAGLASVVGYFTLVNALKVLTVERGIALPINTGVFGGILMGLLSAWLYNRFYQTKLHPVLGFFSGKRLVPIVTAGTALLVGVVLGFVWPPIQSQINAFGASVMSSDFGPAFYAAGKRLLIPVGLHHVYYPPFLYEFGEFVTSSGQVIRGESARFFAGDTSAGRFMASEFPLMLFGLPAATLAMYLRAPKNRRKAIGGIMLSAALTSIITGITEPIEFSFIFVAPVLYVFHVMAAFSSGLLVTYFDIHLGYTFSASVIDYVLGFFNAKNSAYFFLIVGPAIALLYFSVFYWAIEKLQLKTPGRETEEDQNLSTNGNTSDRARNILQALGGKDNLKHLDACITRLRLTVRDVGVVDKAKLKSLGAAGLLDAGGGNLQVIFGVESDLIKDEMFALMSGETAPSGDFASASVVTKEGQVIVRSPMKGQVLSLKDVPDETFSDKILGDGIAIEPTEGIVYSPVDGVVAQIFRTNHAIGIITSEGLELLIHVGIDTVKMQGRGFTSFVKKGDRVKSGDKLIEFDMELVRREAKSIISPVVVTNMSDVKDIQFVPGQNMSVGHDMFRVTL
jgi:glucose-specific phosphotransferase system IIA component